MKNYTMTVTQNEAGKDVFRLLDGTTVVSEISLGKNEGAAELKQMFVVLLEALVTDEVSVKYEETEGYSVVMYKDVCEAYVEVLQEEIKSASEMIKSEGLRH